MQEYLNECCRRYEERQDRRRHRIEQVLAVFAGALVIFLWFAGWAIR